MDNVDNVTTALREKMSPEQLTQLFGAQEGALDAKLVELIGEEGFAKYKDHTKNLVSAITAEQFKSMMTGEKAVKDEKAKQMSQILAEAAQGVRASAGLPDDYQLLPILNFRNIASESEGERGLQLLEQLYTQAEGRLASVLDKDELAKFQEFRAKAISNGRGALTMNRTLMAPIAD